MLLVFILTLSGFSAFCLAKQLKLGSFYSFGRCNFIHFFSHDLFKNSGRAHLLPHCLFSSPLILSSLLKGREEDNKKEFRCFWSFNVFCNYSVSVPDNDIYYFVGFFSCDL